MESRRRIAIRGYGFRAGTCSRGHELWDALHQLGSFITRVDCDGVENCHAALLPQEVREGFDVQPWPLTPEEVADIDPQVRWALECAMEAVSRSGISLKDLQNQRVGVWFGFMNDDFQRLRKMADQPLSIAASPGAFAGQIMRHLGLKHGVPRDVTLMCSTGLAMLEDAQEYLRGGKVDSVIVVASNWCADPTIFEGLSGKELAATSPTGRSDALGSGADGYVRGEGCVALLLQTLQDPGLVKLGFAKASFSVSVLNACDGLASLSADNS